MQVREPFFDGSVNCPAPLGPDLRLKWKGPIPRGTAEFVPNQHDLRNTPSNLWNFRHFPDRTIRRSVRGPLLTGMRPPRSCAFLARRRVFGGARRTTIRR